MDLDFETLILCWGEFHLKAKMNTLQLNTSKIHPNCKKWDQDLSPSKVVTFLYEFTYLVNILLYKISFEHLKKDFQNKIYILLLCKISFLNVKNRQILKYKFGRFVIIQNKIVTCECHMIQLYFSKIYFLNAIQGVLD